jgi:hypothetical protein
MTTHMIEIDSKRSVQMTVIAAILSLTFLFVGCGGGPGLAAPVDLDKARQALKTSLDSWKEGKKPADLKAATPSIVVQDFDWMGGAKLVSYEVTGDGKNDDANQRIPVQLTLKTAKGEVKKSVTYLVGTDPVLTVFRDFN